MTLDEKQTIINQAIEDKSKLWLRYQKKTVRSKSMKSFPNAGKEAVVSLLFIPKIPRKNGHFVWIASWIVTSLMMNHPHKA